MSIKAKLIITLALVISILIAVLVYAHGIVRRSSLSVMAIYDRPMMSSNYARDVLVHLQEVIIALASDGVDEAGIAKRFGAIDDDLQVVEERLVSNASRPHLQALRGLLKEARGSVERGEKAALSRLLPVIAKKSDVLIESEFSSGYDYVLGAKETIDNASRILVLAGAAALLIATAGGFYLFFSIVRPIRQCVAISQRIAQGQFDNDIRISKSKEFALLFDAFRVMQGDLVRHIESRQQRFIAALDAEKARLKAVMDNVQEAIITIDDNGIIQSFNIAAERIFGYVAEETIGKNVSMLMPEPHRGQHDGYLRRYLETGENRIIGVGRESFAVRSDGAVFPVALGVTQIEFNGRHLFIGLIRDITEQKQREERLHQALDRAEEASRSKSEFLANMSHELRTPLNSILGMTRLIMESGLNAEQGSLADMVLRSSKNLLEIVNDILDLSKIEANEIRLEHIGIDLMYLLNSVVHTLETLAREKQLTIIRHYSSERLPFVLGDPARLMRILTNLIGNAIKYTDKGQVAVRAVCSRLDEQTVELRCEIQDSGIGIAKEKFETIFDKFVQADTSTTRRYGGTGLGLAITKQLVELMGGHIGVESELGAGSTFWFAIPFEKTDRLSEEKQSRRKRLHVGTIPSASARVLVAEDHPMNQMLIAKILARFGVGTFTLAETGAAAVEHYRRSSWDVILMDCHMPELNGYDATREIRKIEAESGSRVPIVAMTANAMIGDKEKCLRCGMDDYISKPIPIDELKEVLGQWLCFEECVESHQEAMLGSSEAKDARPGCPATVGDMPPVDLSEMKNFCDGDVEAERELIHVFVVQSDKNMAALAEHRTSDDAKAWRAAGHMFKGGAASVGARVLSRLCAEAELCDGSREARSALFDKINIEYERVKSFLKASGLLT